MTLVIASASTFTAVFLYSVIVCTVKLMAVIIRSIIFLLCKIFKGIKRHSV